MNLTRSIIVSLDAFRPAFAAALATLDLTLDEQQVGQIFEYWALLNKWNAAYNLTAIRDPQQQLSAHLLDCLAVLPHLKRQLSGDAVVLDVGAGGGLPSVLWAIATPSAMFHSVDTVGKKIAFIQQVKSALQLDNLEAHHSRVEHLTAPQATLITARAFASLTDWVAATRHLRAPSGSWAAMKATLPQNEIIALPPDVRVAAIQPVQVPLLDAERHLIFLEPV